MGRRDSRKNRINNINNTTLSRKKFRKLFCRRCGMCGPTANMRFCYNNIYKLGPKIFTETIFPLMQKNKNRLEIMSKQLLVADFQDLQLFRTIFCLPNVCAGCCGDNLSDVKSCHAVFCSQVNRSIMRSNIHKNKTKKIKPKSEMFVAIYGDSSLEMEVLRILENYNSK